MTARPFMSSITDDRNRFDTCLSVLGGIGTDVDPTPFAFSPHELAGTFDPKNFDSLIALGDTTALLKGLGTDMTTGLRVETFMPLGTSGRESSQRHDCHKWDCGEHDELSKGPAFRATLDERRRVYGENILPRRSSDTLLQLIWSAFKDKVLILLSLAAVVLLALSLFRDLGVARVKHWVEGVAILVSILIVVIVGFLNDWQTECQFTALTKQKEDRSVKVIRDGLEQVIDVKNVVVGDIGLLEPGDIVPCDGIILSSHNLKCNESNATGESDVIKKASYDECLAKKERVIGGAGALEGDHGQTDCFIVSGSKVLDGVGSYIVVAVGQKSFNGGIMMTLRGDTKFTPLQVQLTHITELFARIGKIASALLFMVLMILFFLKFGKGARRLIPIEIGTALVNIVIISLTLVVIAVPKGFPRTVSLALAFITKRMVRDKLFVRQLGPCETSADVSTVICTDQTLTQSGLTVVAGSVGIHAKHVRNLADNKERSNVYGVRTTVEKCRQAGVSVKMCTSHNITTARSIALQSGIYSPGGIAMEGPVFRSLDERHKLEVVPSLQILAQSSPEDERILVETLKELGETVAVTGHSANDVPVLETADVGFSMGISGTDVAKEASDITLMDDNFASVIKAIMWGRCINDCVRKFLQFYISTQVTAIIISLVSAFTSCEESPVLSPVQLLWINIIMDTFAALAFAADPAFETLLDRKPNKKAKLFNVDMYKQIFSQSVYQVTVILTFHITGQQILGFPAGPLDKTIQEHNKAIVQTVVFNSLVFALIFNSINCRRLDKKLNIFEGITRNYYFLAIISIEIAVQILIVCFGGTGFGVMPINRQEWVISILLGVASIPIGALARLLPNYPFEILFISMRLLPTPEVLPVVRSGWRTSIDRVQENRTISSPFNIWGCGSNISSPAPAYLRDRSVQHACASLTVLPVDARPFMICRPVRPMRKSPSLRAGVVLAGLSMALTFIGVVFTGMQISAANPKS